MESDIRSSTKSNTLLKEAVSKSSSTISTLQSELLKKIEIITSLNGKIANLSDSDHMLKRNDELEKENRKLKNTISTNEATAAERIRAIQAECKQAREATETYRKNHEVREVALRDKETDIDAAITTRANKLYDAMERRLINDYKKREKQQNKQYMKMEVALIGYFIYVSLCRIMTTMLQLGRSKRFTGDVAVAG